jgi:glycosyltransferase involved in cell wall biosynthesis
LHNPININNSIKKFIPLSSSTYSVAYAGSIHNFHYDALIKVAEAIYYLKNKGISIDLIIYTNQISWDTYREILQKFGVINGGVIPYDNLFSILNKSDILLCTTSFDSKFKNIVSTSVFTKITDYLASARPVWCFGPEYSANNFFLKENSIGYANSFEEVISIVDFLITRLKNREFERKIVNKQLVFLQDKYDENIIMKSLIAFLNSNN